MKFCETHWAELRRAIDERGLSHLVAKDGHAAAERLVSELDGTANDRTYDPLMDAHNMILTRALEQGGLYLLGGDFCPVCEAIAHTNEMAEAVRSHWIDGPAEAVLAYCREHGLAGEAS